MRVKAISRLTGSFGMVSASNSAPYNKLAYYKVNSAFGECTDADPRGDGAI